MASQPATMKRILHKPITQDSNEVIPVEIFAQHLGEVLELSAWTNFSQLILAEAPAFIVLVIPFYPKPPTKLSTAGNKTTTPSNAHLEKKRKKEIIIHTCNYKMDISLINTHIHTEKKTKLICSS